MECFGGDVNRMKCGGWDGLVLIGFGKGDGSGGEDVKSGLGWAGVKL